MPDLLTVVVIGGLLVTHLVCAALGFSIGATVAMTHRVDKTTSTPKGEDHRG